MSIALRKEKEKADMKQLIRAAALKMFLEEGYAKTSIRNIATAIHYSPGTIYLYYKDKDELLYEVQHKAYGDLLKVFKAKAKSDDPFIKLEEICKAYIEFGLENPELYDLMFIIRAPMNVDEEAHKANGDESLNFLAECVKRCIDQKLIRYSDAELATLEIWAMTHGLVSLNLRSRLKVMYRDGDAVSAALHKSIEDYLQIIKV